MFVAASSTQCIRAIMDRVDIPYNHKIAMVAIAMNHDYKHSCEVGVEILRKQAGMSQRTMYRTLKRAEELGFITKSKNGNHVVFRNQTCDDIEMHQ